MDSLPTDRPPPGSASPRFWQWGGWGFARSWREVRFRDVAVLIVVAATIWGKFDVVARGQVRSDKVEIHKTDLTVFTEAGAAFFDGRDPYKVTNPRGWFYLYPPLFAILLAPLAPFDAQAQVGAWFAISIALAFACFFEGRKLWAVFDPGEAEPPTVPRAWIGGFAIIAAILPALDCLQRGQVGLAVLYPMLLGARLVFEGRSWGRIFAGGVVLTLPVVIKLIPLLPVGALLGLLWVAALVRRGAETRRASAATAGIGVGFLAFVFLIPGSLVGWGKNLDHLSTWAHSVAANRQVDKAHGFDIYSLRNQSLANGAHLLTRQFQGPVPDKADRRRRDEAVDRVTLVARGLILVILTGTGLAIGRRGDRLDLATAFGLATAAMLLVSPLSWGHYFLLEVPAILFVPLYLARRGRIVSARVFAAAPAVLILAQYAAMSWAGAFGVLGLGTTAWFLIACVEVVRLRDAEAPPADGASRYNGASHLFGRSAVARLSLASRRGR